MPRKALQPPRCLSVLPVLAIAGLALTPVSVLGQEGGGILLTFGIEQSLRWEDNPDLDIPSSGSRRTADTRLSFGAVTETATQRLALSAAGSFRFRDGESGGSDSDGFQTPSVDLSYSLDGASSRLSLSAYLRETDVDTLDFLLGEDEGVPVVTAVTGSGTQRVSGARASLDFGTGAPFGGTLALGYAQTEYTDTTDPDLVDNERTNGSLTLRFDLSARTTARATLSGSVLDEEGTAEDETTRSLTLGLDHALANGALTLDATTSETEDGTRHSLRFGRSLDLPSGAISASLGLAWPVSGDPGVIGTLDWRRDLARGQITLALSRSVTGDARDQETELSRISLGLSHEIGPRLGASLTASWQDSIETGTDLGTTTASLEASLTYALSEDWGMSFGASHRQRDRDGEGKADANSVFLSLGRSFEFRP